MSFLNNFQYQYHNKHLEKLLNEENLPEFFSYLKEIKKNKDLFYKLSLKFVSSSINKMQDNILEKKIIFINSFLDEDFNYLKKFFKYYLENHQNTVGGVSSYLQEIDSILKKEELVDFNTLINESYFFQWMMLNNSNHESKFIFNNLPFFSSQNNFNFTKPNLAQSYVLILNDPYLVYQKIKTQNNNDQDIAKNIFLNLDDQPEKKVIGKTNFLLNKKGWHIHSQSWSDPNVLNSLRGKVILKKDLISETFDVLSSIILHFVQSGVEIELNYDLIENFVSEHPISEQNTVDISNKEKKFIDNHIAQIYAQYDI